MTVMLPRPLIAACTTYAATAQAADVTKAPNDNNSIVVIEGSIQNGDCEKLLSVVRKLSPKAVYLASPGGNMHEAMRIVRLVRALKMATIVPVFDGFRYSKAIGFPGEPVAPTIWRGAKT
jgi:hypothetical protein